MKIKLIIKSIFRNRQYDRGFKDGVKYAEDRVKIPVKLVGGLKDGEIINVRANAKMITFPYFNTEKGTMLLNYVYEDTGEIENGLRVFKKVGE